MRFPGKHFSTFRSPNQVLTPLKSASPGKRILKGLQKARPAFQNLRLGGVKFIEQDDTLYAAVSRAHIIAVWRTKKLRNFAPTT